MKRGVIASPGLIQPLPEGFRMERSINDQELAFYVLYWDDVIIPDNNLVSISVPQQQQYIDSGAISRPKVVYGGSYQGDMVTNAILGVTAVVASEKVKSSDEDWVLHQFGSEHVLPEDISASKETLRLLLHNTLPTPNADVPLVEILEFKERFKSARSALHDCLDETYQEVLAAPDAQLHARKAISRLKDEIRGFELDDVKKSGWSRFSLNVEFKITPEKLMQVGKGVGIDLISGSPVPVATLINTVASFFELGAGSTRTVGSSKSDRLGYLTAGRNAGVVPFARR